jgi:hypothetical protein
VRGAAPRAPRAASDVARSSPCRGRRLQPASGPPPDRLRAASGPPPRPPVPRPTVSCSSSTPPSSSRTPHRRSVRAVRRLHLLPRWLRGPAARARPLGPRAPPRPTDPPRRGPGSARSPTRSARCVFTLAARTLASSTTPARARGDAHGGRRRADAHVDARRGAGRRRRAGADPAARPRRRHGPTPGHPLAASRAALCRAVARRAPADLERLRTLLDRAAQAGTPGRAAAHAPASLDPVAGGLSVPPARHATGGASGAVNSCAPVSRRGRPGGCTSSRCRGRRVDAVDNDRLTGRAHRFARLRRLAGREPLPSDERHRCHAAGIRPGPRVSRRSAHPRPDARRASAQTFPPRCRRSWGGATTSIGSMPSSPARGWFTLTGPGGVGKTRWRGRSRRGPPRGCRQARASTASGGRSWPRWRRPRIRRGRRRRARRPPAGRSGRPRRPHRRVGHRDRRPPAAARARQLRADRGRVRRPRRPPAPPLPRAHRPRDEPRGPGCRG